MAIVINGSGTVTGISVGGLPDGIVDAGTLATNSVDSAELIDGSIDNSHLADNAADTAEIADNAITLAKMAGGTDGNIISYDASGDPVAIATGDDGQVLTSAGAGAPPAFEDAAGGNTPYFNAYSSAEQSVSDYTNTKISCNTEAEDSGGNYDPSTNYRFTVPAGQGGKYFVTAGIKYRGTTTSLRVTFIYIYKNGSVFNSHDWTGGAEAGTYNPTVKTNFISHIIDLAETDYIELWGSCDDDADGSPSMRGFFLGYKIG